MPLHCLTCDRSAAVPGAQYCSFCGGRLADPHATVDHVEELSEVPQSAQETVPDASPPQRIGGYRIVRRLGQGGMGSVYEAEADDSGKRVAVKLLSPRLAANPTSVERFKQEGRLASQISHPRCVFVYHADADAGRPFIVMELMPGQTLKDVVEKKGRLSPEAAVARILDVVDGLIEAHRLGLIHRDVKPSNCFLTADDRVKVGDFGLSKSLVDSHADGQLTGTGAFLGTVLYAPPEQIRGEEVGYDSDVYSVCATLYYLLAGRAPYQHESMTAALAKAISEPPPAIRTLRADVPKALDRVVLKGLERDRKRRFNSLEELRDALQQLMPEEQAPARTRMLVAAYLIDMLVTVFIVYAPVEFAEWLAGLRRSWIGGYATPIDPITTLSYVFYFGACEGFTGATLGKWLLGLRVVPHGSVGPPGFGVAMMRSAIFHFGWLLVYAGLICMTDVPLFGLPLGILLVLGGIAFLSYRVKKANSNRGLHDVATGCHVVQLPRAPHRVRLVSQSPNRLDHAMTIPGLPASLGGYMLRGRLAIGNDGSQVWIADDRSLGRRVLIHLRPNAAPTLPPNRPGRLRMLGTGELAWQNQNWHWHAFAAPAGAPLADMVPPDQPLNWPDARLLLEQIVEELLAAEKDGTRPATLSVNSLWSEHGGRVFLLDFPVPSAVVVEPVEKSLAIIRQAATLMLEGSPRIEGGPVKAPLPPRASEITNRLFAAKSFTDLAEMQRELAESHAHAPTVTVKLRATHLGLAAVLLAFPLAAMFFVSLMICFEASLTSLNLLAGTKAVLAGLDQPETITRWQSDPGLRNRIDAALPMKLQKLRDRQDEQFEQEFLNLSKPERYLIARSRGFDDKPEERSRELEPEAVAQTLQIAAKSETDSDVIALRIRKVMLLFAVGTCGFFAMAFIVCAFLFRGGIAYLMAGVALVRRDGRRAGRFRCAIRELALWLPVIAVLLAAAWLQVEWPAWFLGRLLIGGAALGLLIAYAAMGLRHPERGPLDRLFGTYRVPL